MEEIATLLEKILAGSTFALTVNRLRDTTLDDRPEGHRLSTGIDTKSLGQCQAAELRELYEMGTWRSGEWGERLRIKPKYADGVAAHSASRIDSLLDGYLDSDKGHIGHALTDSIEGCEFGHHEANGFIGHEKVSALNDFRDYLIIGAAILGTSRVAGHLRDWMAGKPLHYRTMALLVGAHIDQNIELESGIRIEKLSTNSKELPQSVPGLGSAAPATYLGGVVLCVNCLVAPALYKPESNGKGNWKFATEVRHSWALETASIDEFCESLSLSFDGCIRSRQVWRDYGELEEFSALTSRTSDPLRVIDGRVRAGALTQEHLRNAWDVQSRRNSGKGTGGIGTAIRRWVNSKRPESSLPDRFIELRIALEALYLDGKGNTEMAFRLATHGALYAGGTIEERRRNHETLRKAYNLSSRAVHAGTLKDSSETKGVLKKAQDLCREGIVKRLRGEEAPNWTDMILSAD